MGVSSCMIGFHLSWSAVRRIHDKLHLVIKNILNMAPICFWLFFWTKKWYCSQIAHSSRLIGSWMYSLAVALLCLSECHSNRWWSYRRSNCDGCIRCTPTHLISLRNEEAIEFIKTVCKKVLSVQFEHRRLWHYCHNTLDICPVSTCLPLIFRAMKWKCLALSYKAITLKISSVSLNSLFKKFRWTLHCVIS